MMPYSQLIEFPSPPLNNKTGWPWTTEMTTLPQTMPDGSPWPKVSIVTPSYNQAEFLEETIRSVLLQGYPNLEYIIMDGGSTDGSVDIIRKYEPWITYWVSQPDKGQADAINKGFEMACGEFLGWINSDDYLYPHSIVKMVSELKNNPDVSFVYGDVHQGSEDNKSTLYGKSSTIEEMLKTYRVPIPQQGSMWRRSLIEAIGPLNEKWHFVLDREFFLRVAVNHKMAYIPGIVGFFRHHSDSKSISIYQTEQWLQEIPLMYEEFFKNNYCFTREFKKLQKISLSIMYLACSKMAFRRGKKSKILGFLTKAIKQYFIFFFLFLC